MTSHLRGFLLLALLLLGSCRSQRCMLTERCAQRLPSQPQSMADVYTGTQVRIRKEDEDKVWRSLRRDQEYLRTQLGTLVGPGCSPGSPR